MALVAGLAAVLAPRAARAADPYWGPIPINAAEYKLSAAINTDIRPDVATELWGAVWRPANLDGAPYPVVVMLHGEHATCGDVNFPRTDNDATYSETVVCSNAASPVVVPNHLGYAYLAQRLASFGYVVISINANRGVNQVPGLMDDHHSILTRGRLEPG